MQFLLLILLVSCAFGYVFDCLDRCECDTDDEVVHCHNGERTHLTLPTGQRLRGFPVIGMTYNNIVNLPDEKLLLNKFPDLKVIDVERNPNFNCSSLSQYDQIKIVSDAIRISQKSVGSREYYDRQRIGLAASERTLLRSPSTIMFHRVNHEAEIYEDFNLDDTLRQLQEFFKMVANRVNQMGTKIQVTLKEKLADTEDGAEMTPMPELKEVDLNKL
ncbi:hypothetical protein OSTOST_10792 [Ostertagia ostertagi]